MIILYYISLAWSIFITLNVLLRVLTVWISWLANHNSVIKFNSIGDSGLISVSWISFLIIANNR